MNSHTRRTGVARQKFLKEPPGGTRILFCGRGLKFVLLLRCTNSPTTQSFYSSVLKKVAQKLSLETFFCFFNPKPLKVPQVPHPFYIKVRSLNPRPYRCFPIEDYLSQGYPSSTCLLDWLVSSEIGDYKQKYIVEFELD